MSKIIADIQRQRAASLGNKGFRKPKKITRNDQLRINDCYDRECEKYVELSLEDMKNLPNKDKLTGTYLKAYNDSFVFKQYEEIMKKKQEEKKIEEVKENS